MNPLLTLEEEVRHKFLMIETMTDVPMNNTGTWFLDINLIDKNLVVEWNPSKGFGITSKENIAYGVGPDEVFIDKDETLNRVIELLTNKESTNA